MSTDLNFNGFESMEPEENCIKSITQDVVKPSKKFNKMLKEVKNKFKTGTKVTKKQKKKLKKLQRFSINIGNLIDQHLKEHKKSKDSELIKIILGESTEAAREQALIELLKGGDK